jgi:hypothetical protein
MSGERASVWRALARMGVRALMFGLGEGGFPCAVASAMGAVAFSGALGVAAPLALIAKAAAAGGVWGTLRVIDFRFKASISGPGEPGLDADLDVSLLDDTSDRKAHIVLVGDARDQRP